MADDLRFVRGSSAVELDFLTRVRQVLSLPQQTQLQLTSIHDDLQGVCSIEYSVTVPVPLRGSEFGIAEGVTVDEQTSARLSFNPMGKLVSSHVEGIDERHLQLVRDQVKKLAALGQIAATQPGAISGDKPWYLEKDTQGILRLKRARMA